jgi:phage/conjugal plasmid C-4 type zinc finger TraR family protein
MAGYGNADDHVGAQEAHVEDSLALHRLQQEEQDNESGICEDCGTPIPAARLAVIRNAKRCASCQHDEDKRNRLRAAYTYRPGWTP